MSPRDKILERRAVFIAAALAATASGCEDKPLVCLSAVADEYRDATTTAPDAGGTPPDAAAEPPMPCLSIAMPTDAGHPRPCLKVAMPRDGELAVQSLDRAREVAAAYQR